jgi:hypothetical protein
MENQDMNKKIIIIAGIILAVIVLIVFLISSMLKNQQTAVQSQPTPPVVQATITTAPGSTVVVNTTPGEEIKIAPTLLTPIPLPKTLGDLKTTLEIPMNYKDISIRYSKGRDLFVIYYDGTIFGAQKTLGELLKQYGVNDPNSVPVEYVSNKAPLLEKPPSAANQNQ